MLSGGDLFVLVNGCFFFRCVHVAKGNDCVFWGGGVSMLFFLGGCRGGCGVFSNLTLKS